VPAAIPLSPARRGGLANEMEAALRQHVRAAWFPHCLDHERGGFFCDFDRQWNLAGPQERMLEFQARQTRAAARLALMYPGDGDLAEWAMHGFRYLRDVMWDREGGGGWYWLLDRSGSPLAAETKHAHSGSYAVQACAVVFAATGEQGALDLALEGFDWFERHALDPEHGGYHSWFRRDGSVIRNAAGLPPGLPTEDPLHHEVGAKDINVQGDWFEALLELLPHTDNAHVRDRAETLADLYLQRLTTERGETFFAFQPDWQPLPGPEQFGYNFQASHRLAEAREVFPAKPLLARAEALAMHAARLGRRHGGGYAFSTDTRRRGPADTSRFGPRRQAWWVEFEALRAFAKLAACSRTQSALFGRLLERQWDYIQGLFDRRFGGVFATDPADLVPWHRIVLRPNGPYLKKSDPWKDASHETDALVFSMNALRRFDPAS
jgi:mannobiose 2-epimerase